MDYNFFREFETLKQVVINMEARIKKLESKEIKNDAVSKQIKQN